MIGSLGRRTVRERIGIATLQSAAVRPLIGGRPVGSVVAARAKLRQMGTVLTTDGVDVPRETGVIDGEDK